MQVTGFDELERKLVALGDELRAAALVKAAMAGAELVADVAGQLAPVGRSGELSGGIKADVTLAESKRAEVSVGPTRDVFYGRFQELGTVYHGAQPFLRPAFDATKESVIDEVRDSLRNRVLAVAARG